MGGALAKAVAHANAYMNAHVDQNLSANVDNTMNASASLDNNLSSSVNIENNMSQCNDLRAVANIKNGGDLYVLIAVAICAVTGVLVYAISTPRSLVTGLVMLAAYIN